MKKALVTGVTGQDGSYMAEFLLGKGYKVFGMERRASTPSRVNTDNFINHPNFEFITADLADQSSLVKCLETSMPDELYNFAAQSFVGASFISPIQTLDITGLGVGRLLEAVRQYGKPVRFYQASSSEMFGKMVENPAKETTPLYPRSPYGVAKCTGHWITQNYRESYKMFNVSGILFNHESERRGYEFVTRKITHGVAKIVLGLDTHITLGNLEARRDWGYAPDFIEAAWLMLQQDTPDDYVIATGETKSIREFLTTAFHCVSITDWSEYVKQDQKHFRPAEVDVLRGDYSKAKHVLNWEPKTTFEDWVGRMVRNDINILKGRL
jgi:GDPmannose 4,6-dehydratase